MDTLLSGLKWQTYLVYFDDVIVFSETFEEHLRRLLVVLQTIRSAGLTRKAGKCHLGFEELQFLGRVVSHQGLRPDPDKITAVTKFSAPTDKKAVRRFLGLSAYYQVIIANFSHTCIASPLTCLRREDVAFVWGEDQKSAFNYLRQRLQTPPVLAHFDNDTPTMIHRGASNVGLGAVLVQWQDSAEGVITYANKMLSRAEFNHSTIEKEYLAVLWVVMKCCQYLYRGSFSAVSDHHSLFWLINLKDQSC